MIKFIITVEETPAGIKLNSESPAGLATPEEIKVGLEFKALVKSFGSKLGFSTTTEWKSPRNEIRKDN